MKAKIIIFILLVVLFTIFVSQNTEVVSINFFFWEFNMSLIVLMVLIGFVGIILGFILSKIFDSSSKKKIAVKTGFDNSK